LRGQGRQTLLSRGRSRAPTTARPALIAWPVHSDRLDGRQAGGRPRPDRPQAAQLITTHPHLSPSIHRTLMMPLLFRRRRLSLRRKRRRSLSVSTRAARGSHGQISCVTSCPARPGPVHAIRGIGHVGANRCDTHPSARMLSPSHIQHRHPSRLLASRFPVANSSSSIGSNLRKRPNCLNRVCAASG
jgi:hypothetical protein